jgi:hypothetical protein
MSKETVNFAEFEQVTADELAIEHTGKSGPLGISVVNTENNGKRVKFTKALLEELNNPRAIQFVTNGDYLYIGAKIPHSTASVAFSSGKGTNIIYSSGFVHYLVRKFKLDFDECTSLAFHDVEIRSQEFEGEEIIFAKIKMSK